MKEQYPSKIKYNLQEAIDLIEIWKKSNNTIVFTNGCFDILHSGHVTYLREASKLGDKLIIGVNSDQSVRNLKGEKRPIRSLPERLLMIDALEMVDMVIPFEEDTPLELIRHINPHFLVKGGDYKNEEIVGAEFVLKNGGQVETLSIVDGNSTTDIIKTILNRYAND